MAYPVDTWNKSIELSRVLNYPEGQKSWTFESLEDLEVKDETDNNTTIPLERRRANNSAINNHSKILLTNEQVSVASFSKVVANVHGCICARLDLRKAGDSTYTTTARHRVIHHQTILLSCAIQASICVKSFPGCFCFGLFLRLVRRP